MHVKQADNVLMLLQFFAERLRPANLGDVSDHFGWPRSSTFNILTTLENRGFLYKVDGRKGFYPTPLWLELATLVAEADPIPERLTRVIDRLATQSGETVWLCMASGMFRLNILVRESNQQVRVAAPPTDRLPIHGGASGHALLSQMDDKAVTRILARATFTRYSESTPVTPAAVLAEIAAGKKRGWFQTKGNYAPGLGAVSVPVFNESRLMAVTVAGPLFRIEGEMPRFAELIYDAIAGEYGPSHCADTLKGIALPGTPKNR
jgi:DNA-binding IclR family transcriptional regulator